MGADCRVTQQYFRTANSELYETIRLQLDAAWGHPTPDGRTLTCIQPAASAPRDSEGRILLAVQADFVTYEPVASILPELLAGGSVEEITREQYLAALPPDPQP
jgi:hypothetical protein